MSKVFGQMKEEEFSILTRREKPDEKSEASAWSVRTSFRFFCSSRF